MAVEHVDILIVGGGIAGLATALHLAQAGARPVLLERERQPGFYASGHNAGIARTLTGRAEHTALTAEGRARLAEAGLLRASGGCLLAADPGGAEAAAAEAAAFGLRAERRPGPPWAGLAAAEHLALPEDGVIDVDGLLRHCAEGARAGGARLHMGCAVQAIEAGADGFRVDTDQGAWHARTLVNAAGAWAGEIGRRAGGLDLTLAPLRRHLVWSPAPAPADRPWAWYLDRPLYLRPESGGLLLCACEEDPVPAPARGAQPAPERAVLEGLGATLQALAPDLADLPIARLWCGLRTFAPDRRFLLGPDPRNPALVWAAALGGHGMTSGLAVGRRVAEAVLGRGGAGPLAPGRFSPAVPG